MSGQHIRGYIWRELTPCGEGDPYPTWHYRVVNTITGDVLTQDNTGAFTPIAAQCVSDVDALRRVWSGMFPAPKRLRERLLGES